MTRTEELSEAIDRLLDADAQLTRSASEHGLSINKLHAAEVVYFARFAEVRRLFVSRMGESLFEAVCRRVEAASLK